MAKQAGKDRDEATDQAIDGAARECFNALGATPCLHVLDYNEYGELVPRRPAWHCDDCATDAIAALVRREVERAVAREREAVRHKPMPGSKERFGHALCAKCGVVIPEPETCCRNELAAIRARSTEGA